MARNSGTRKKCVQCGDRMRRTWPVEKPCLTCERTARAAAKEASKAQGTGPEKASA